MQLEVLNTADGSATLLNKELNVAYHSKYGALQESNHIFINNGLSFAASHFGKELNVLEIGFGTGLNALLTLREAIQKQLTVNYFAIEKYPVPEHIFEKLNYSQFITEIEKKYFDDLLYCKWEEEVEISPYFKITKHQCDAFDMAFTKKVNVIYYDAFGPGATPEMWQQPVFEKSYNALIQKGCLVTFCAKGEVKRTLKKTGFKVQSLSGPPGKREITRAIKE